jgi:hypothetical protein
MGAEVCTGTDLTATTCGFFLAASADEAERAKAAMAMNDTNLVIVSSLKQQNIGDTLPKMIMFEIRPMRRICL